VLSSHQTGQLGFLGVEQFVGAGNGFPDMAA
jgi:hypothetical protein